MIELIVVVLILGVISAVAVPKISGLTDKAKEATLVENLRNVQIATLTAAKEDPTLNVGGQTGQSRVKGAAKRIAQNFGEELGYLDEQSEGRPYFPSIEIPTANNWYFNAKTDSDDKVRLYIYVYNITEKDARMLAQQIGLGTPDYSGDDDFDPSNSLAHFTAKSIDAGDHRHRTLYIKLHEF